MLMATVNTRRRIEPDSVYFLKIVLYILLASFWIKFTNPVHIGGSMLIGIPIDLLIGMVFSAHDHLYIDPKVA